MAYNSTTGVYSAVASALNAFAGKTIPSADWNAIFLDMQTAFTAVAQGQFNSRIFTATAVNFNSANTDTTITITLPTGFTKYVVSRVYIYGASASISTATCGLFTAAAAAGFAIVASGTAITVTATAAATANSAQIMTLVSTSFFTGTSLFFRVQTAQGSPATANVVVEVLMLP